MKKLIGSLLVLGLTGAANASLDIGETIYVDFGATAASGNYNQIYASQLSIADTIDFDAGETTGVGLTVTVVNSSADPVANTSG
jgi:hypothetical protein